MHYSDFNLTLWLKFVLKKTRSVKAAHAVHHVIVFKGTVCPIITPTCVWSAVLFELLTVGVMGCRDDAQCVKTQQRKIVKILVD